MQYGIAVAETGFVVVVQKQGGPFEQCLYQAAEFFFFGSVLDGYGKIFFITRK